jgi:hypothetical protein
MHATDSIAVVTGHAFERGDDAADGVANCVRQIASHCPEPLASPLGN